VSQPGPIHPDLAEWIVRSLDGTITPDQFAMLDREITTHDSARLYYLEFIATYVGLVDLVGVLPKPAEFVREGTAEDGSPSGLAGSAFSMSACREPGTPERQGPAAPLHLEPDLSEEERLRRIESYAHQQLDAFMEQQRRERLEQETRRRGGPGLPWTMEEVRESAQRFVARGIRVARTVAVGSLAAVVILVTVLTIRANRTVGTLVESAGAKWNVAIGDEGRLRPRRISLEQGYARVRLNKGAEVIVQAPSTFTIEGSNRMSLKSGWITAKVPPIATGFTVKSPGSSVVDFGTEFGLLAGAERRAEVHVFDGRIECQYGDRTQVRRRQTLKQGEAAFTDEAGRMDLAAVKDRPNLFVRQVPADGGYGIPGKRLDLADMVGGGNGLGTGALGIGIDPSSGAITPTRQVIKKKGHGLAVVSQWPFVDGVFVPDGNDGPVFVSSTGIVFEDCPKTNGTCFEAILNGAMFRAGSLELHPGQLAGCTYGTRAAPSISMHPNAGITFDLDEIRSSMPDVRIERFGALCGVSQTAVRYAQRDWDPNKIRVDFWVLVDGRVRFSRTLKAVPSQSQQIGVPLGPRDRFLTLATTSPGDYQYCWGMFAEPRLELTMKKEERIRP